MHVRIGRSVKILLVTAISALAYQNCGAPKSNVTSASSTQATTTGCANCSSVVKPAAPSQLSGTAVSSAQVNLTWNDNSNNETSFKIERSSTVSGPFTSSPGSYSVIATVGANVTSYSDSGLTSSTTYKYRVSAVNSAGSSAPSAEISVLTPAAPASPPSAPSNLTATAAAATIINLTWNDNSNNEFYFKIERSLNGGTTFTQIATVSTDVRTYQDVNLSPATTYTYRLRANNTAGDSAYSANSSATTQAAASMNTYSYISANILGPNCVGCHGNTNPAAGISYASYTATRATVVPGNSANSQLYSAVSGNRMPPGAPLSATQINAIKSWIDAGAANN